MTQQLQITLELYALSIYKGLPEFLTMINCGHFPLQMMHPRTMECHTSIIGFVFIKMEYFTMYMCSQFQCLNIALKICPISSPIFSTLYALTGVLNLSV